MTAKETYLHEVEVQLKAWNVAIEAPYRVLTGRKIRLSIAQST